MYTLKEFINRLQQLQKEVGEECPVMISKNDVLEIAAVEIQNVDPEWFENEHEIGCLNYGTGMSVISVF